MFGILQTLGKEAYVAEFSNLGIACRILVPGYSEVYPVEDLIWDNTNKALDYREDILTLHRLDDAALGRLVERLQESQLDNYTDIKTLIGIEFDENTVWGQLTILELKLLIYLALGEHDEALELVSRRAEARRTKDWSEADRIRDRLAELGWEVKDSREGPKLRRLGGR